MHQLRLAALRLSLYPHVVTYSLYRRTRSARLVVTTPEGSVVTVDNLVGDSGFALEFECVRKMSPELGESSVVAYNLPAEAIGLLEYAQVRRIDDPDSLLVDQILRDAGVPPDGEAALQGGFLVAEVLAGYDGQMSRVFRTVGARASTGYTSGGSGGPDQARDGRGRFVRQQGGTTYETRITGLDSLDGLLFGLPMRSFPSGTTTFELVDYLRQIAGLGPGNLTPSNLAAIIGESRLSSPYHVSAGEAQEHIKNVLQYLPIRYFFDDREFWICGRDDVPAFTGAPAYVPGEPEEPDLLLQRPRRDEAGRVRVVSLLCPRILPGRLVRLTEAGLALALQGLSPTEQQITFAQVPPGLYRCDEIRHSGSTTDMDNWTSSMVLRPGVAKNLQ